MHCPGCEHDASKVLESRSADAGEAIRRRRECLACGFRFTTHERIERSPLWVAKEGGRTEPFDRSKLLRGLARACSKRDVPTEVLEGLVIEIETTLVRSRQRGADAGAVSTERIGQLALAGLRRIDDVASVRFASVYHAFDSVEEFREELDELLGEREGACAGAADAVRGR